MTGESSTDAARLSVLLPPVEAGIDGWLQRVTWVEAPLRDEAMAQQCATWLVLAVTTPEAQALGERLSHYLQGQGFACTYHCSVAAALQQFS